MQIDHTATSPDKSTGDNPDSLVPDDPENKHRVRNAEPRATEGQRVSSRPSRLFSLWQRLVQMARFPPQNNLLAGSRSSYPVRTRYQITISTQRVVHIAREQAKRRRQIEIQATQVRLNVAKLQLGVWYYRRSESDAPQNRAFSIEYERDFLPNVGAHIHLVYEHGLIRIDVSDNS